MKDGDTCNMIILN